MKRDSVTYNSADKNYWVILTALEMYLEQFKIETIISAPRTSAINNAVREYNRLDNLFHGTDAEYRVDRVPRFFASRVTFEQGMATCGEKQRVLPLR